MRQRNQYPSRHCTGRLYYVVPNLRNLQIQNNEINKKKKMWADQDFADVTLACEDRKQL